MKPDISIVVPVYRVEDYIERCVDSLIYQTFDNIEIILVDDGSPDRCPEICDAYAVKDSRIKVIHKPNGGLSDARNAGIREATGHYVLFVDSDDFIELDACEKFKSAIGYKEADIIVGEAKRIEGVRVTLMQHQLRNGSDAVSGEEYLKAELKTGTMYMAAWLNLYNRDFLINNELEFKVGLLHEDEQFTPRAFLKAKRVIGIDIVFYNYIIRGGSITTKKNKIMNAEHLMKTYKELENIYSSIKDDELRKLLNNDLVSKFLNTFQVAALYRNEYSYLIDKFFLKGKAYTKKNKYKVYLFCFSKRGYFFTNWILKFFKKSML